MNSLETSGYTFREAVRSDIPTMKYIRDNVGENALVSCTIEIPDYERGLFEDGKGWVCLHNGEVVGFSCGRTKQKDVWALFIKKEHEGHGIGNRLMEFLESWMFSEGIQEINLTTQPGTRAEHLYRKRGWRFVGYAPNKDAEFVLKAAKPR